MAKQRSNAWYLLPFFFSIIGGIIGYFIIKKDDPVKAKRLIIVGLVVLGVTLANIGVQTSVAINTFAQLSNDQFLSIIVPPLSLIG